MRFSSLPLIIFLVVSALSAGPGPGPTGLQADSEGPVILPEQRRAELWNEWLEQRLDLIIPDLMRREGIDMWMIFNRENSEDPLFFTMVPRPAMYSPGSAVLIFVDRGPDKGVERFNGGWYPLGVGYKRAWTTRDLTMMENLAEKIEECDPRRIGINISERWPAADGMSATLLKQFKQALDPEYASRLVSAENLCVGWLETRSAAEIRTYPSICRIAHNLIREFFSSRVIVPDVTTTEEVVWWIRDRMRGLGLDTWFQPSISIQRGPEDTQAYPDKRRIIRRGDLLHCDVGIRYLGLCTDMQWSAYVCRTGESDAPEGLKKAFKRAVRTAEILMGEYRAGRSGREIVQAAMAKASAEGLRPLIYSHPLGIHGHGSGCTPDARDPQKIDHGNPLRWDYPLHFDTAYAIELSATTKVPEWNNQDVRIGFEESGIFTRQGCRFIDGHQTELLLISPFGDGPM
jgi:Xaa-Pro aminopeptidase